MASTPITEFLHKHNFIPINSYDIQLSIGSVFVIQNRFLRSPKLHMIGDIETLASSETKTWAQNIKNYKSQASDWFMKQEDKILKAENNVEWKWPNNCSPAHIFTYHGSDFKHFKDIRIHQLGNEFSQQLQDCWKLNLEIPTPISISPKQICVVDALAVARDLKRGYNRIIGVSIITMDVNMKTQKNTITKSPKNFIMS